MVKKSVSETLFFSKHVCGCVSMGTSASSCPGEEPELFLAFANVALSVSPADCLIDSLCLVFLLLIPLKTTEDENEVGKIKRFQREKSGWAKPRAKDFSQI